VFTRGLLQRAWSPGAGMIVQVPEVNQWTTGRLDRAGVESLRLPSDATGAGYSMDPSDPRTWRQQVIWT